MRDFYMMVALQNHAITVKVGEISKEAKNLLSRTKEALQAGIKEAVIGNKVGDISHAIERVADSADLAVIEVSNWSWCRLFFA